MLGPRAGPFLATPPPQTFVGGPGKVGELTAPCLTDGLMRGGCPGQKMVVGRVTGRG